MSFGKNPHVPKAEAAEQKAQCARDESAREQAWLEAGRLWERAADREKDGRRKQQYAERADAARVAAETPPDDAASTIDGASLDEGAPAESGDRGGLN